MDFKQLISFFLKYCCFACIKTIIGCEKGVDMTFKLWLTFTKKINPNTLRCFVILAYIIDDNFKIVV